jgi:hypothetical protein
VPQVEAQRGDVRSSSAPNTALDLHFRSIPIDRATRLDGVRPMFRPLCLGRRPISLGRGEQAHYLGFRVSRRVACSGYHPAAVVQIQK